MGRRAETGVGSGRIVGSLEIARYNEADICEAEGMQAPLFLLAFSYQRSAFSF